MFGDAIGRCHDGELVGRADKGTLGFLHVPQFYGRIDHGIVAYGILRQWTFHRLVMLGEGPVRAAHAEDPCVAFGLHDERVLRVLPPASIGVLQRVPSAVRHVADPSLGDVLPTRCKPLEGDHGMLLVPWLALGVNGRAVIDDAPVDRPAPCPLRIKPDVTRIETHAPGGHVARLGVGGAVQPVAGGGTPIGLELAETGQKLSGVQIVPVDLLGHSVHIRLRAGAVVPCHIGYCTGMRTAHTLVAGPDRLEEPVQYPQVGLSLSRRMDSGVPPLAPATRVGDAAFLLHRGSRRQQEDLGLYGLRVHVRAVIGVASVPEVGRLRAPEIHAYEPVQLLQGIAFLQNVGPANRWVLAHADQTLDIAVVHSLKERDV